MGAEESRVSDSGSGAGKGYRLRGLSVKILAIGLGGIGQRHVRNLRTLLGARIEILAYRVRGLPSVITPALKLDATRNVEGEYCIRVFDNLESALGEKPQIALICNPSSLHISAALACANAGCDLFLEKPVSNSMDGVAELIDASAKNRLVVMVGYQLRFHPCIKALRATVSSGVLGRVLALRSVVGEYLPAWHTYEDYRQVYASRSDLGGGVILSQIHEFDYLYSIFGPPRRVFSVGGHLSNLEVDVEDVASTLMECRFDGRPLPVHVQQDYLQRPPSRSCEVIGDEGRVCMDLARLSVSRYDREGKLADFREWKGFERNQLFLDEMRHFLQCVETRREPLVGLSDGLWSLRIALAAKESIVRGGVVELDVENSNAAGASS
jgi:predicted dehydrogenase